MSDTTSDTTVVECKSLIYLFKVQVVVFLFVGHVAPSPVDNLPNLDVVEAALSDHEFDGL